MESKKGYYIDIQNGVVYTAEEREEVWCKKFADAIKELEQLKALMNDYFCRYRISEPHTVLENLAFEISTREQTVDTVIDLLKGGTKENGTSMTRKDIMDIQFQIELAKKGLG